TRGGRTCAVSHRPQSLPWPVEGGKWGVPRGLWRPVPPRPLVNFTGNVTVTWQVDAHEDVVTAAGTFPAFRITQKIETIQSSTGGSGQQFGQILLWYAPDVQRFVKAQGNLNGLNWELNRTTTPAPPPLIASPAPPRRAPPPQPTPPGRSGRPAPPSRRARRPSRLVGSPRR